MNANRVVLLMTLLAVCCVLSLTAAVRPEQSDVRKDATEEIQEAVEAFHRVQDAHPVPAMVLKDAVAVGVFDNLVRGLHRRGRGRSWRYQPAIARRLDRPGARSTGRRQCGCANRRRKD